MLISMKRRGFTIIELTVTITIMGILLVLGVINLANSQINSRDTERKTDIETIATHLETYYTSGNDVSTSAGSYPTTDLMTDMISQTSTLRDIDTKNLIAPGAPTISSSSLVPATNSTQTTAGVTPQPQNSSSQNQYVYQPIYHNGAAGSLCTSGLSCQSFNLYYISETDGIVHMIMSRNQ